MATDQKLDLLRRVPLFEGLGGKEIEAVGRLAEEVDLPAGRTVMREGESGSEFFLLVDGTVKIDRGGKHVRTVEPGDFFGEIALVAEGPRTATATTDGPAKVLVLGHREFHSLMDQFPAIRICVLEALARRIRNLEPEAAH